MDEEQVRMMEQMPEVPEEEKKEARVNGLSLRLRLLLSLVLSVAVVLCKSIAPDSGQELRRWIVGDGSERVMQAFFSMEEALEEGDSPLEAWDAFCRELTIETA